MRLVSLHINKIKDHLPILETNELMPKIRTNVHVSRDVTRIENMLSDREGCQNSSP